MRCSYRLFLGEGAFLAWLVDRCRIFRARIHWYARIGAYGARGLIELRWRSRRAFKISSGTLQRITCACSAKIRIYEFNEFSLHA